MAPTLVERRDAILAQLDDPNFAGDPDELLAEADEVSGLIAQANERAAARSRLMSAAPPAPADPAPAAGQAPAARQVDSPRALDLGQRLMGTPEFAQRKADGFGGKFAFGVTDPEFSFRAAPAGTVTTDTYPSETHRVPGVLPGNPDLPLLVADLLDQQTSTGNSLEYVRDNSGAPVAPPTGWNAAAVVAEGANKPMSSLTFETISTTLKTLAHWIPITRQAADDEGQLTGYINGRLTYGLRYVQDAQILTGNGTTEMQGILTTAGIGSYQPPLGNTDVKLITLRRARTVAELNMYPPDSVILHPQDWEDIELDTDETGSFRVIANVQGGAPARLWGLTVVSTVAIAAGTALIGGFRMGATLWSRQGITLLMTDSHADFFIANTLVLLAEMRANVAVHTPKAFVNVTFAAAEA